MSISVEAVEAAEVEAVGAVEAESVVGVEAVGAVVTVGAVEAVKSVATVEAVDVSVTATSFEASTTLTEAMVEAWIRCFKAGCRNSQSSESQSLGSTQACETLKKTVGLVCGRVSFGRCRLVGVDMTS